MRMFIVTVPVKTASGWQQFKVEADSSEDAKRKVSEGGGKFHEEELTVNSLDFKNADAGELL